MEKESMDPLQTTKNIKKLKQTSSRALQFQWILLSLLFDLVRKKQDR